MTSPLPPLSANKEGGTSHAVPLNLILGLFLIVALVGFYLPWVNNPAAALSANAYDLAEWVGLAPWQRSTNPPMQTPFLLRAVLAGLALLFGFRARTVRSGFLRFLYAALALILALTLLPPLGFFRTARDDINYQQLFSLSLATLALLAAIATRIRFLPARARLTFPLLEVLAVLLIAVGALFGYSQATAELNKLSVRTPLGPGLVLTLAALAAYEVVLVAGRAYSKR